VVRVSSVPELQNAVVRLRSNTTILIADGVYDLTHTLNIDGVSRVTLRGASGNRDGVVLRGRGMGNKNYGSVPHIVAISSADDVTVADLTLRDAYYHLIQVHGESGPQRPRIHNVRLIDAGEQLIKGSTNGAQRPRKYSEGGIVECSLFEYTDRARSDYTNGVNILAGGGWIIRDNVFRRMRAPVGSLAGPAVLMWRNSRDTIIERNLFIECDRAIALGISPPDVNSRDGDTTYEHQGGVVRNNMIYRVGSGDVGIIVNYARDYKLYHNTIVLNGTYPSAIEYRFAASTGQIAYNLTDGDITSRDGGQGILAGNQTAARDWFAGPGLGDLHLAPTANGAVRNAVRLADVVDDYDGDPRPDAGPRDVGADERAPRP
jgi:hypothetical protein